MLEFEPFGAVIHDNWLKGYTSRKLAASLNLTDFSPGNEKGPLHYLKIRIELDPLDDECIAGIHSSIGSEVALFVPGLFLPQLGVLCWSMVIWHAILILLLLV